jgi:hypothetical protein
MATEERPELSFVLCTCGGRFAMETRAPEPPRIRSSSNQFAVDANRDGKLLLGKKANLRKTAR